MVPHLASAEFGGVTGASLRLGGHTLGPCTSGEAGWGGGGGGGEGEGGDSHDRLSVLTVGYRA